MKASDSSKIQAGSNSKNLLTDANLHIIFSMTAMAIVGAFSIAPALPRIAEDLAVSKAEISLIMTVFTFPGIFLMPVMGACADRFGRRNVVAASLILFGLAGSACFFVKDFYTLLVMRFLQGIGAAPLSSLNIAFISDIYSGHVRTRAMGYNQAVLSVAAAAFTVVGGALATLDWKYPFLLPLFGVPIGLMVRFRLESPVQQKNVQFAVYIKDAWQTVRSRPIVANYLITILGLIVVWGSYVSYLPILMALKLKSQPYTIGMVMMTMMITSALASSQMGKLSELMSGRMLFKMSFALYGVALILIPLIGGPWTMIAPVAVFGIAQGILIPNIQNYLGRFSSIENRGIVMSVYGSCIRIGQTLGPLIMGLLLPMFGINGIFFICAALALTLIGFVFVALE